MEKYGKNNTPDNNRPYGLIFTLAVLVIAISVGGWYFYESQEQQLKDAARDELTTIGHLKTEQIAQWRQDRLNDAREISANPFFIEGVTGYFEDPDPDAEKWIRTQLQEIAISNVFENALLVDPDGSVRFSLNPSVTSVSPTTKRDLAAVFASSEPVLTDLYLTRPEDGIRMDSIAPLVTGDNETGKVVGAVILTINPDTYLYPLIQSWPVPSDTSETLIVGRRNDSVMFMNDLRHRMNTALNLTIPLTRTEVPAVMAVQGKTGVFEGIDYRGEQVISVLEPIPGSPWFMVAKVDSGEAYAAWRARAGLILVLIIITLAGSVIVVGLVWQRRQKYYYIRLFNAESESREMEILNRQRLDTLVALAGMEGAGDEELAEYVLDAACRLTQSSLAFVGVMSPDESAFDITVWSKPLMKDRGVTASFTHIPVAEAGIWADSVRVRKLVIVNGFSAPSAGMKGLPGGHAPIKNFISVPIFGEQRIVMVAAVANRESGYTEQDIGQLTLLMQGVWTHMRKRKTDDELHRKNADLEAAYEEIRATEEELRQNYEQLASGQKALAESEEKFREIFNNANDAIEIFEIRDDMHPGRYIDVNEVACRMLQYSKEEVLQHTPFDFDMTDYNVPPYDSVTKKLAADGYATFETGHRRKDGTILPVEVNYHVTTLLGRRTGIAVVRDITERKTAERALTESEEKFRTFFMTSRDCAFITTHDGRWVDFNDTAMELFGYDSRVELFSVPITDLYADPEERKRHMGTITAEGFTREYPLNLKKKDGAVINALITTVVRKNSRGEVTGFQGTIRDVTEKRFLEFELKKKYGELEAAYEQLTATDEELRANYEELATSQQNLRESEQKYREFFTTSRDTVFITAPDGRWIDFNDAAVEMFGYAGREELINVPVPELYEHPEERAAFLGIITDNGFVREYPVRLKKADGTVIDTLITTSTLRNADGSVRAFIGTIRDVTDKKLAEDAVRESEKRYRRLFESAKDGILILNRDTGTIIDANPFITDLLGYSYEELAGKHLWDIGRFKDAILSKIAFEELQAKGYIRYEDLPLWTIDGRIRDVEFVSNSYLIDHTPVIQCNIRDISDRKLAERALAESEVRFRHISDLITDFAYSCRRVPGGTFTIDWMTGAVEKITGFTAEEIHDMSCWRTLVIEDDIPVFDKNVGGLSSGEHASCELRIRRKDGTIIWLASFAECVPDPENPSGHRLYGGCRDITGRRQADEALQNSRNFLNSIIEQSPYAMWISDNKGTLISLNTACCDILHLKPSEVIGAYNVLNDSIVEEEGFLPLVRSVFDEGKTARFELKYDSSLLKRLPLERKTKVYLDVTIFPIRDLTGKITNAVIQHIDITDRKQAEQALADEMARRRILLDQSRDGIVTLDDTGGVVESNRRFADMLGYTPDEIGTLHIWDWEARFDREKLLEMLRTVDETGDHFETHHKRKDGTVFDVEISTNAAVFAGEKLIFCIVRDITGRKLAEEQLKHFNEELEENVTERTKQLSESLAERELLLREIHHRVKNNLQIVASLFNLQSRYISDEKILDAVRESQNRVRAMALVHERIYREEKLSSINMREYVSYLGSQLFGFYGIRPSRITLELDCPDIQLDIDTAIPLGLVMNEILSNALKHAFPDGKSGRITVQCRYRDPTTIDILIGDDGIGMPEGFDWRNAPSLGLRLVISLVEQLHGTIDLDDAGPGTLYHIIVQSRKVGKNNAAGS